MRLDKIKWAITTTMNLISVMMTTIIMQELAKNSNKVDTMKVTQMDLMGNAPVWVNYLSSEEEFKEIITKLRALMILMLMNLTVTAPSMKKEIFQQSTISIRITVVFLGMLRTNSSIRWRHLHPQGHPH